MVLIRNQSVSRPGDVEPPSFPTEKELVGAFAIPLSYRSICFLRPNVLGKCLSDIHQAQQAHAAHAGRLAMSRAGGTSMSGRLYQVDPPMTQHADIAHDPADTIPLKSKGCRDHPHLLWRRVPELHLLLPCNR